MEIQSNCCLLSNKTNFVENVAHWVFPVIKFHEELKKGKEEEKA